MDFFSQQEQARKKTGVLVGYFIIAVGLIILFIYAVFVALFKVAGTSQTEVGFVDPYWDPSLFGMVAGCTLIVVLAGSLSKIVALSGGGSRVAEMMGGRQIPPDTTDLKEKRLVNIVEEMAIASGIPVPPVYVLDQEKGVNAFAAGFSPSQAVVAVTRGTLDNLSRDELQGVMAHEFSHIFNGDMKLNIRLMGVLQGILIIALIGEFVLRGLGRSGRVSRSGKSDKGGGAIVLFGLALFVIGYIGVFFGRLIKSAVSRQREFLADASAVQFTRSPDGIAGALKKIGGLSSGSCIRHPRAEEASHLFFGNGLRSHMTGLLATHPALQQRILALDPQWDGQFLRPVPPPSEPPPVPAGQQNQETSAMPDLPGIPEILPGQADVLQIPVLAALAAQPERVAEWVGAPLQEHVQMAQRFLEAIPDRLRDTVHEPYGARAVIYLLVFDHGDPAVRKKQLEVLESRADPGIRSEVEKHMERVRSLPAACRFPLADLSVSALRALSPNQYGQFRILVQELIEADDAIDLFEYALSRSVLRPLDLQFGLTQRASTEIYSIRGLVKETSVILSLLAHYGSSDPEAAHAAFAAAARHLPSVQSELRFLPEDQCRLELADQNLAGLQRGSMKVKRQLITACLQCLIADREITMEEAELFRAVAGSLDCPIPPWIAGSHEGKTGG